MFVVNETIDIGSRLLLLYIIIVRTTGGLFCITTSSVALESKCHLSYSRSVVISRQGGRGTRCSSTTVGFTVNKPPSLISVLSVPVGSQVISFFVVVVVN